MNNEVNWTKFFKNNFARRNIFFSKADANAGADAETPMLRLPNSYLVMVFLIMLVRKFSKYKTSR